MSSIAWRTGIELGTSKTPGIDPPADARSHAKRDIVATSCVNSMRPSRAAHSSTSGSPALPSPGSARPGHNSVRGHFRGHRATLRCKVSKVDHDPPCARVGVERKKIAGACTLSLARVGRSVCSGPFGTGSRACSFGSDEGGGVVSRPLKTSGRSLHLLPTLPLGRDPHLDRRRPLVVDLRQLLERVILHGSPMNHHQTE